MTPSISFRIFATSLLLGAPFALAGCDVDEPPSNATNRNDMPEAPRETLTLELALPADTPPEQVEAIAKSAETHAGSDVGGAKVMVHKKDDGPLELVIQLWGAALDDEDEILARLRSEHEILNRTPVAVDREEGVPEGDDLDLEFAKDASPEEIESQVRAQLAERGVEGDVEVQVRERADGKHEVEVRVESEHSKSEG